MNKREDNFREMTVAFRRLNATAARLRTTARDFKDDLAILLRRGKKALDRNDERD